MTIEGLPGILSRPQIDNNGSEIHDCVEGHINRTDEFIPLAGGLELSTSVIGKLIHCSVSEL